MNAQFCQRKPTMVQVQIKYILEFMEMSVLKCGMYFVPHYLEYDLKHGLQASDVPNAEQTFAFAWIIYTPESQHRV